MLTPFFSVVMPSYLGDYPNAAKDRPAKFLRAVYSLLDQTCMDWELRVVSDGCDVTDELFAKYFASSCRCHLHRIDKQPLWSGAPRNVGIQNATGKWITYMDTDDIFGPDHLAKLRDGLKVDPPNGWAYFNDWYWDTAVDGFKERECNVDRYGKHGTSNLVHRRDLGAWWPQDAARANYAHDRHFVNALKAKGEGVRIPSGRYFVCHDIKRTNEAFKVNPTTGVAFDV
jgi:glycosyltransferase involved in cell wall biosynthesis